MRAQAFALQVGNEFGDSTARAILPDEFGRQVSRSARRPWIHPHGTDGDQAFDFFRPHQHWSREKR
jgi:hypothetical protein